MKSLSLARVLPVLDTPGGARAEPARLDAPRPELHLVASEDLGIPAPLSTSGVEAPVVDRWEEGYEAGIAIGRAQAQAEAAERSASIEEAVAAARARWSTDESERILVGVGKALGVIEDEICAVAERILAQVAARALRERALAQFAETVRTLLRNGDAGVVTIHAPEDLRANLEARLGSVSTLEFIAHESAEVWVRSGATAIETHLDSWRSSIFPGE